MITGDHPATARTIGHALGLADEAILARATPADKLALVQELQENGAVVAVTGDGVNDAPALRRADVGVAMGRTGTEAAREAAAIVLTDDDFATIVAAIAEGRRIGDNIRKFVAFLLSANLGEVLVFTVAILAGLGAPLAVIQVLLVNLVTDGLPALALARDPASLDTMTSPPRTGRELFDSRTWHALLWIGVLVGGRDLRRVQHRPGAWRRRRPDDGFRDPRALRARARLRDALVLDPAWRMPSNRWLDLSVLASVAVVAGVVFLPAASAPFATAPLGASAIALVVVLSLVPLAAVELLKAYRRRTRPPPIRLAPQAARATAARAARVRSCGDPSRHPRALADEGVRRHARRDRARVHRRAGRGVRLPRAERRRQDDDDPAHARPDPPHERARSSCSASIRAGTASRSADGSATCPATFASTST